MRCQFQSVRTGNCLDRIKQGRSQSREGSNCRNKNGDGGEEEKLSWREKDQNENQEIFDR